MISEMRTSETNEIITGLTKAGVDKVIAEKIATRYFSSEINIRDLENLEKTLKLEFNGKFKLIYFMNSTIVALLIGVFVAVLIK